MMFPHTVTLYNVVLETDMTTLTQETINYITVLDGVLLTATKAKNVTATGLTGADDVTLYIPFDVKATDGITGEPKEFIGDMEFFNASDKNGLWTLSTGKNTFFVKGKVIEPDKTVEYINMRYDDVYNVTTVDRMDYGTLKHFEVGGA
jgi:hypothetical protein